MQMIMPSWVRKLGAIENVFGLMTTKLGKMATRAFKPDTPKIPKADFGKIRGLNPRIARTMAVLSCNDNEAGLATVDSARTRWVNPSMAGKACPFPEFDDPGSAGISMISESSIGV